MTFAECDGTFSNTERRVQRVRKAIEPIPGRANWQTICEMVSRMGYPMNYASPREIWDEMASLAPSMAGINYDRLEELGSLQWPCPTTDHPGTQFMLAYQGHVPICGVPGGALYSKFTTLDLLLPRIFAEERINRSDIVALGHGGFCEECKVCHYPACPFGKATYL